MLVDDRIGSGDLVPHLKRLGIPAELARLDFADCAFPGRGPADSVTMVGLEVKTISDVCQCMHTGRFAGHQLPGLLANYDDVWLIVEGHWRPSISGGLEVRSGTDRSPRWFPLRTGRREWMWREVQGWLTTVMTLGGVRVWQTHDRMETVRACASIYRWWTEKPFEEHKSLKTFSEMKGRVSTRKGSTIQLAPPTLARCIYKELPGIGWERSQDVEAAFASVQAAVNADVASWQRIPGIGPKTAEKVVRALQARRYQQQQ